ncbi:MAG: Tim44 domain-containing protein [Alphaproteobacteria bacterium]|nr:Tim44 domain-containing protein [Alphaproteobacteria bacterium]
MKQHKLRLISKKTGEVIELDAASFSDFINKEIEADFSNTAKIIFVRVSEAFAKGRLSDIKNYLNEKVLPVFEKAILSRENLHQKAEFTLIGFKDVKVLEDTPDKKIVSFTTEQINLLKDEKDNIIEGDPLYVATVTENWTFTHKKENTWVVSGIENKEAHFA